MTISHRRWVSWLGCLVVLAAVMGSAPTAARSEPPPSPPPGADPADSRARHTVTLVTGDRVEVATSGKPSATVVQTAPGTTAYSIVPAGNALYVIPDQALPLIASGRLDKRLFDVTGLVEQGYDDASTKSLPVIIEYGAPSLAKRAAPAGARVSQSIPSIGGVAAEVTKSAATSFWRTIAGSGASTGSGMSTLAAGAKQVWLDARVQANLDRSAAQIGAPAAWQRGLDGAGVKVAVLDTGIDATHPDLAGQVVAAQNFTEEPDTDDRVGHGTHVASIIAGTGAASSGQYVGVAHGADLINGKVMQLGFVGPGRPDGVGRESWILAGMQWAVDQGADIVNMSLGNSYPDGNDPLSQAVDALTAQSGTLFVVSAGNSGPDHYTVGGPAAADQALAVGSVDRDDSVSFFSSRGPRMIDGVLKPELTAPGQNIVAARAAHGRIGIRVGTSYTTLSGTSMAAPHVAGAAAILLQQHPDWGVAELRAALTSTAAYNPSFDAFAQGAGRIDVDRATGQDINVDAGTLNMGYFPPTAQPHGERPLTYRNTSTAPVTLTLAAQANEQSSDPAPAGTLTVSPSTITVPAGGSAQAQVSVDLAGRPAGAYSGRVTASGPGGRSLATTVGFVKQGEEAQATFRAVDRNGNPAEAFLILRSPRFPDSLLVVAVPRGGSSTVQVDPGDYSILGYIRTPYGDTDYNTAVTVVADPELELTQPNRTITFDARRAQPFDVQVPRDVDVNGLTVGLQVERPELGLPLQDSFLFARGPSFGTIPAVPMSVLPFDRPRRGHGELDSYWSLVSPRARASVTTPKQHDLPVSLMDGSARLNGSHDLAVVDAGAGTPEEFAGLDVAGKVALVRETAGVVFSDQAAAATEAGATALLVSAAQPGPFLGEAFADIPVLAISHDDGDWLRSTLAGGSTRIQLSGTPSSTYLYDLAFREHDAIQSNTVYRPSGLAEVRTSYHADDSRAQQRFWQRRMPAWGTICGYCADDAREGEDWNGGVTRVEYLTAGVPWRESLLQDSWLQWDAVRAYPRGVSADSWAKAPAVPGVPIQSGAVSARTGDQLQIRLAGFTDADPAHLANMAYYWFQGSTTLSRDGQPVAGCVDIAVLNCDVDVPADRARYTLTAVDPAPIFTDAVQTSTTTWTFSSQHGEAVLPLIDIDYDVPLSLTNTLVAGSTVNMRLGVARQPGSAGGQLGTPTVEVSYDGGSTWTPAAVDPQGHGQNLVHYKVPALAATSGQVGLRVTASDAAGNSIRQEVPRAFRLTS
jgi:subtilisin family serine protease